MSALTLHGYWRSSAAYRVRIALNLKALAYDQVAHDLRVGAQRDAGYQALSPQGLVPVIEADGLILDEAAGMELPEQVAGERDLRRRIPPLELRADERVERVAEAGVGLEQPGRLQQPLVVPAEFTRPGNPPRLELRETAVHLGSDLREQVRAGA